MCADIKGSTIISHGGNVSLHNVAQVPNQYIEYFKSVSKFKLFNMNNICVLLRAIKHVLTTDRLKLEIIVDVPVLTDGDVSRALIVYSPGKVVG